ncbi:L-alanine-DL-glutamate epimerase-like enolase superfamily enzyme [Dokdonia sp. Hel_I_63]|uniref:mandelate racemase/muconate lactonizing enzyme family protein n=1 Tax=unclassified Dokdonia TaxID=2615033 RepID=UPI00020A7A63|nr:MULTISPECIES: dipeptide epimerase [unclassified Dokdonia]AEE18252.1 Mandelate racemase/muconate lactonizing protein [Dokdonia sp. 4H-3-7-5]TVZ22516.1 L-alanine-DL-glutamate epimerase-like enolase superfamily enzyme [Dokdonia sp. Hel_I_63]
MKITNVSYERLELTLTAPYTIAYETVSQATNFILKIETDSNNIGLGCAAPDLEVTKETGDDVARALDLVIIPYLKGKNALNYARILDELKPLLSVISSALAMVDMALLDIASKKMNVPLYQFLGGYRDSIATSITIGILSVEETLKQAQEYVDQGFTIIKLKGGLSLEEDVEKIHRLRENHPHLTLRFDGNQGYTVAQAVTFVEQTRASRIEILEQPTLVADEEKLGEVTRKVHIPVMADESLKSLKDAFRLAQNSRMNMVNIKIQKVGGIMEAMHINSVARAAGLEAMIGCIDECRLGISSGLHFALSRPNTVYADLDGHLDFENDPFKGLFSLEKGILRPNGKAGLGLSDF